MSPATILGQIDQLPITQWNYKSENAGIKHIGPVAQDFYALFNVGNSNTSISTIDPAGIALLGIQGLDQKITALQGSLTGNATATALSVYVPSNFSGDSVGQAQIKPGASSVRVTFIQAYKYQPIVTFSPVGRAAGQAITSGAYITDITATGFTIEITPATAGLVTSESVTFDWHSFASEAAQLTVSDGTTQPIALVVANSPSPATAASGSAALSVSPAPSTATSTTTTATSTPASSSSAASASTTPDTSAAVLGTSTPVSSAVATPVAPAAPSTPSSDASPAPAATSSAPAATPAAPSPVSAAPASPSPAPPASSPAPTPAS